MFRISQQVTDQLELAAVTIAVETVVERLTGNEVEKSDVSSYISRVVNWAEKVDPSFTEGELEALCWSHVMTRVESILKGDR